MAVSKELWLTEFPSVNNGIGRGRRPYWFFSRVSRTGHRIADFDPQRGITGAIMRLCWRISFRFK